MIEATIIVKGEILRENFHALDQVANRVDGLRRLHGVNYIPHRCKQVYNRKTKRNTFEKSR